jgi:hypothetical protein
MARLQKSLEALVAQLSLSQSTKTNLWSLCSLVTRLLISLPPDVFSLSVLAATPSVDNCAPFGGGSALESTYWFYRYANLPAFNLEAGDVIAFDLGLANEFTPAFASIALATPSEDAAGTYTSIVYPSAGGSKGDTTIGNFELDFTISAPYIFAGGALIMRFKNGGVAASASGFSGDTTCSQVLVGAGATDTSG